MIVYKHTPQRSYRLTTGVMVMIEAMKFQEQDGKFEMRYKDENFDVTTFTEDFPNELRLENVLRFPFDMTNELVFIADGPNEKEFIEKIKVILDELL